MAPRPNADKRRMRCPSLLIVVALIACGCERSAPAVTRAEASLPTTPPKAREPAKPAITVEEVQTLIAIHSLVTAAFDAGEKPDLGKIALLGQGLSSAEAKFLKQRLFELSEGADDLPKLAETWSEEQRSARRAKADADALQASVQSAASKLGRGGAAARNEFNDLVENRIPSARRYESEASQRAYEAQNKVASEFKRLKFEADAIKAAVDELRTKAQKI